MKIHPSTAQLLQEFFQVRIFSVQDVAREPTTRARCAVELSIVTTMSIAAICAAKNAGASLFHDIGH